MTESRNTELAKRFKQMVYYGTATLAVLIAGFIYALSIGVGGLLAVFLLVPLGVVAAVTAWSARIAGRLK